MLAKYTQWAANRLVTKNSVLRRFLSTSLTNDDKLLVVHIDKDETLKFPAVWLRDNCQCSHCFHADTNSRILNWTKRSNLHVRISSSAPIAKDAIQINWSDEHKSTFKLDWLRERNFSEANRERLLKEVYKPEPILWGKKEFFQVRKTFEFRDVIEKDEALLDWLQALAVQGFAIIKNATQNSNVVRQLADRIGFIKRTTYGEVFEVKSKKGAKNYAYLMTPLPLHTDMPYYEYKAGINILHCMVQSKSEGGANLMTDGFYIANKLKEQHPKEFELLKNTPVDWYDVGKDSGMIFHNLWRQPVICLDSDQRWHRINQNVNKRDSYFNVPLEKIDDWYNAYGLFLEMINDEAVEFKVAANEVFVFNNLRMLHGRTAYVDSETNQRHMVGAYVDWDLIYSKIRILKGKRSS